MRILVRFGIYEKNLCVRSLNFSFDCARFSYFITFEVDIDNICGTLLVEIEANSIVH